ncbi:MAG TPA: DUF6119 family protein, partial [Actinopolymorphaceae bacterium]|nr:DUF6119 family protein [Actinopolymorphaceae bacterium]
GVEICDLLARDGTFVHVKHAHGSAPLSHLFMQALVAVQTFKNSSQTRQNFYAQVKKLDGSWPISAEFEPTRLVFAILLKAGTPLGPDTLFPFAQVALVQVERTLRTLYDVDVEVIGIDPEAGSIPPVSARLPAPRDADPSGQAQLSLFRR